MPHLIIETSENLVLKQPTTLLQAINDNLWQSAQFDKPNAIKSRIYTAEQSLIGLQKSNESFVVVHFYLMAGRDDTTKSALIERIFQSIRHHVKTVENIAQPVQIFINATELSQNYFKQTI